MKLSLARRLALGVAVLPLALAGCGGSGTSGSTADDPIVLGTSLSMTGALGAVGRDLKGGYEQLIGEVNAKGGVSVGGVRRKVKLVVLDNRSDPNTAGSQVRELVLKNDATAILGSCTPPISIPEALAAEQQRVPYVGTCTPVNAFVAGNTSGWKYAWNLFFSEEEQAANVAEGLARAASNKKVALFTDTEPDGVIERGLYKKAFAAKGLEVVGDYTFPVGTTDFSTFINDAKAKGAQLVAGQMIPPDGIALWKQMKSLGLAPKQAFVAKASNGQNWVDALGTLSEGTLAEGYWSPTGGKADSARLDAALSSAFPNLPDRGLAVLSYTVAKIVTDAVAAAGTTDPEGLNAAIGKTSGDYPGGTIAFNKDHIAVTPYLLLQLQDGKPVQIVPPVPSVRLQDPMKGLT